MTTNRTRHARLLAFVTAIALLVAACGDDSDGGEAASDTTVADDSTTTTAVDPFVEAGADTAAATLRTDLEVLMGESVLVAADAAQGAALGEVPAREEPAPADADEEEAATTEEAAGEEDELAPVDANARDLADVVGSVLGADRGEEVFAALQSRLFALDTYARAGSPDAADQATEDLAAADAALSAALTTDVEGAGSLSVDATLEGMSEALLAVADDPAPGATTTQVHDAVADAEVLGADLAPALAVTRGLEGDADAVGAELRADLAGALVEHSYLIAGVADPTGSPYATPAAVEDSTATVAGVLEPSLGTVATAQLRGLLEERAVLFQDYAEAEAGGDEDARTEVLDELAASRDDLGAFFESQTDGALPLEAVAEDLVPHQEAMVEAIDALVAEDEDAPTKVREAALQFPPVALNLALTFQLDLV